jgi:hypothetical protein
MRWRQTHSGKEDDRVAEVLQLGSDGLFSAKKITT